MASLREIALFENNGLTMGEQCDAIQNLIPRSIQNFAICHAKKYYCVTCLQKTTHKPVQKSIAMSQCIFRILSLTSLNRPFKVKCCDNQVVPQRLQNSYGPPVPPSVVVHPPLLYTPLDPFNLMLWKKSCLELIQFTDNSWTESNAQLHGEIPGFLVVFLKRFWRTHVHFWGHWYPCLDFWWRLLWVSKPEWAALFALRRRT